MAQRVFRGVAEVVQLEDDRAFGSSRAYPDVKIIFEPDCFLDISIETFNAGLFRSGFLQVGDLVHFTGPIRYNKIEVASASKATGHFDGIQGRITRVTGKFGEVLLSSSLPEWNEELEGGRIAGRTLLSKPESQFAFLPVNTINVFREISKFNPKSCFVRAGDMVAVDVVRNCTTDRVNSKIGWLVVRMNFATMVYGDRTDYSADECLGIVIEIDDSSGRMILFCSGLDDYNGDNYCSVDIRRGFVGGFPHQPQIGDRYRFSARRSVEDEWIAENLKLDPDAIVGGDQMRRRFGTLSGETCWRQNQQDWRESSSMLCRNDVDHGYYNGFKVNERDNKDKRMFYRNYVHHAQDNELNSDDFWRENSFKSKDDKYEQKSRMTNHRSALTKSVEYKGVAIVDEVKDTVAIGIYSKYKCNKIYMPVESFEKLGNLDSPLMPLTSYLCPGDLVLFVPEKQRQNSLVDGVSSVSKRVETVFRNTKGVIQRVTPGWGVIKSDHLSIRPFDQRPDNKLVFFSTTERSFCCGQKLHVMNLCQLFLPGDQVKVDAVDQELVGRLTSPRWRAMRVELPNMVYGVLSENRASDCLGILVSLRLERPGISGRIFCNGLSDDAIDVDLTGAGGSINVGDRFRFCAVRNRSDNVTNSKCGWSVTEWEYEPFAKLVDRDGGSGVVTERGTGGMKYCEVEEEITTEGLLSPAASNGSSEHNMTVSKSTPSNNPTPAPQQSLVETKTPDMKCDSGLAHCQNSPVGIAGSRTNSDVDSSLRTNPSDPTFWNCKQTPDIGQEKFLPQSDNNNNCNDSSVNKVNEEIRSSDDCSDLISAADLDAICSAWIGGNIAIENSNFSPDSGRVTCGSNDYSPSNFVENCSNSTEILPGEIGKTTTTTADGKLRGANFNEYTNSISKGSCQTLPLHSYCSDNLDLKQTQSASTFQSGSGIRETQPGQKNYDSICSNTGAYQAIPIDSTHSFGNYGAETNLVTNEETKSKSHRNGAQNQNIVVTQTLQVSIPDSVSTQSNPNEQLSAAKMKCPEIGQVASHLVNLMLSDEELLGLVMRKAPDVVALYMHLSRVQMGEEQ